MPSLEHGTSEKLAALCGKDGEFRIAARHWTGGFRFAAGERIAAVQLVAGKPQPGTPADAAKVITLTASEADWDLLLSDKPPRFCNDIWALSLAGRMRIDGDQVLYAQYYPAIMRAVELLRPNAGAAPAPVKQTVRKTPFDSPIGRYVHLDLGGQDYRVYFEEAGRGIPLLLQHTAGSHGSQWRHLFECTEITDHFRLIAYDLPFHGKSVPPVGPQWWAEDYKLTGPFVRSVPVTLAKTLQLDRPVFMGCSVGGLLALDLACHHPDVFQAVISLEGSLKISGEMQLDDMTTFWHPQVSNEYKSRAMDSLMSPASPKSYRKETCLVYASGWPPSFLGDLHYYFGLDLRAQAAQIDTRQVGVHILSGEYDHSGTMELGQEAHKAIAGSTWTGMNDIGHFPMSENPDLFISYILPVLEKIKQTGKR